MTNKVGVLQVLISRRCQSHAPFVTVEALRLSLKLKVP